MSSIQHESDPQKVVAMLVEIQAAHQKLLDSGESTMLFLDQAGLTMQEQVDVLEYLGEGEIKISFVQTDEPVDWYETNIRGVWVGNFQDSHGGIIVRSIEVTPFPELAATRSEDLVTAKKDFADLIKLAQPASIKE